VVVDARAQEPWACTHLFNTYAGRVASYLRNRGAAEPDDLTSEVFLRVFSRLDRFEGNEVQFRAWMFSIAHHLVIDDHRARSRRPRADHLDGAPELASNGADVEQLALARVGDDWAEDLLAILPPEQRVVVALRVTADLPIEEVARILRKRPGAVKSLQHRALAALRTELARRQEIGR
jgi:RNA polymerase sigma-70 factor (ECF subfamily)